jgi:hypothetical protein
MKQMIGNEQIEEIIVSLAAEKEIISLDKNSVTRLCSADEMACWSYLSDTSDGERPLPSILRQFQVDKEADLADYAHIIISIDSQDPDDVNMDDIDKLHLFIEQESNGEAEISWRYGIDERLEPFQCRLILLLSK